jgi:hypothetical protein
VDRLRESPPSASWSAGAERTGPPAKNNKKTNRAVIFENIIVEEKYMLRAVGRRDYGIGSSLRGIR